MFGRWRLVRACCLCVLFVSLLTLPLSAAEPKGANITFSNLLLRLDNDPEIAILDDQVRVHVLEYMRSRGYNSVGAENLVFDKDRSDEADFVLGGTIRELDCYTPRRQGTAACRVGIEWQLLHVASDRVVYKLLARYAEYGIRSFEDKTLGKRMILGAVERLLMRQRFRELLAPQPSASETEVSLPRARIRRCDIGTIQMPDQSEVALGGTGLVVTEDGFGSGVFINDEGYMLTAAHVVAEGRIRVRLKGGTEYPATVLRSSKKYDVALIKAQAQSGRFPCLSLNSQAPAAGSDVFVVGSPGGEELAFSISKGIVSGLRTIDETEFIQTDASVNPGNSGGPMLGSDGRVQAIMSFKIAGHAFEGLAFGVPVPVALSALSLMEDATSDPSLATPVVATRPAPAGVFTDTEDGMPEIDPEVTERRRRAREKALQEERDKELDAITPTYVKVMRYGGWTLAVGGTVYALIAYGEYDSDNVTRDQYESARLKNDIGWTVAGVGLASAITSYILAPSLPKAEPPDETPATEAVHGEPRVSVVPVGPLGAGVRVRF